MIDDSDPIKSKWSLGFRNIDFIEEEKKRRKKRGKKPLPDPNAKRPNFVDDEILFHPNLDPEKKKRFPWPGPCIFLFFLQILIYIVKL